MKNFPLLLFLCLLIISCSKNSSKEKKETNAFYEKAFDYKEEGKTDSSFLYFYKAKDVFFQQKDSFGIGKCLANLAIIQETKGDYFGSQETGLSALKYLNESNTLNHTYLSINYNTLGMLSSKLKDYKKAIEFYKKAISFSQDSINKNIYTTNLANNYRRNKNYKTAIEILSYSLLKASENSNSYSRILDNLALAKYLENPNYNPVPEYQKALKIRLNEKDNWGLNSTYAHLSDYYTEKQPDSALFYAHKMYAVAKELQSPDDQMEALQKLIPLDNLQNSKKYFKIYQNLSDSVQTARNKAKNQFAMIRYETEKNKTSLLATKAESTERQNHIIKQYIIIGVIITILIVLVLWFKKRQQILQQEKLLEIKNTELKYSKKVHDVVANGLYHTMIEIENQPDLDKEKILNRIEKMYEESRDIAHNRIPEKDFYSRFSMMINSYSSQNQRILAVGYQKDIWENISDNVQSELYYIIREILVNMKKHSKATLVSLKFEKNKKNITIKYTDNGVGIHNLENKKGTGIRNTENRIEVMRGDIIFEKNPNGGLIIQITIPTHLKYV